VPPAVAAIDVLIVFVAFAFAYLLRFYWEVAFSRCDPAPPEAYLKAMGVGAYCWLMFFKVHGLYDFSKTRSSIDTVHIIARSLTYGLIVLLALTYFYREFSFSRLACVYAWLIAFVLFTVFRIAVNRAKVDLHRRGVAVRRLLVVGGRSLAAFLVDKVAKRPELGYRVVGALDDDPPPAGEFPCAVLGRVEDIEQVIARERVDRVFMACPVLGHLSLLRVIETCERLGVRLNMVSATYDLQINNRDFEDIDGVPLVSVNEQESRRAYEFAKRVIDIAAASTLLILLGPFLVAIAMWIRRSDGGPALFVQRRVGKDGRTFSMVKFRTMVPDAEKRLGDVVDLDELHEPVFKIADDPRVTPVGRWLRRTSLDELPQLLNVLAGHMSLVGPRPEEEKVVARYGVQERRRLKALPGITGLQQVECRGTPNLAERLRWDIVYLRKRTLLLDLWIVLKTVWVVATGRGAS